MGQKMKYFGRERICASFIEKNLEGKTLNLGAGEIKWIENDVLFGKKNFISSDIDENNLGKDNLAIHKRMVDAENIPFNENYFSQVIILDVLEHIKNDSKVLDEIHRVLKKSGILVLSVPNDTLLSFLNPIRYAQHERHYSISKITGLLKQKGFKIEKIFAGGGISELLDLYTHLFIKYTTGKKINLKIFDSLRDREYKIHNNRGNEIIIRATKK